MWTLVISWGLADFPLCTSEQEHCAGPSGFLGSWRSLSMTTQPGDWALRFHSWQFMVTANLLLGFELILTRYGVPVLAAVPRIILPQHTRVVLPLLPNISIWLETSCFLCKSVVRWLLRELLLKVCILRPIWVAILQAFATSGCAGNKWKIPGDSIENLHLDS